MPKWLVVVGAILFGGGVIAILIMAGLRYQTFQKQAIFSQAKNIFSLPTSPPTPTSTPTPRLIALSTPAVPEGWQILTSRQDNFSVYYPADWLVNESRSQPADLVIKIFPQRWQGQQEPWATSVNIEIDSRLSPLEEYERLKSNQGELTADSQVARIEFAGEECLSVTSKLPQTGGFGPQTVCLKEGAVYKFQVFAYYKAAGEPQTAQQILDTFRFLR